MDVSELRKRILRALDEARKDAVQRRASVDAATAAFDRFLSSTAVPMMRQAATVLGGAGHSFVVHAPSHAARLASEGSPQTFLEVALDVAPDPPVVIGRVSLARGRQGGVVEERPLKTGASVDELTEDDLSAFLTAEIPRLILKP
jgi:hypothetical protein